jgi:hypothetical protein
VQGEARTDIPAGMSCGMCSILASSASQAASLGRSMRPNRQTVTKLHQDHDGGRRGRPSEKRVREGQPSSRLTSSCSLSMSYGVSRRIRKTYSKGLVSPRKISDEMVRCFEANWALPLCALLPLFSHPHRPIFVRPSTMVSSIEPLISTPPAPPLAPADQYSNSLYPQHRNTVMHGTPGFDVGQSQQYPPQPPTTAYSAAPIAGRDVVLVGAKTQQGESRREAGSSTSSLVSRDAS